MYLKNTAGQFIGFVAINATTGAIMTGTTGFAAFCVLDGGSQVSATGSVTDKGNGQYSFALSQADTNGFDNSILFTMTGMIAVEKTFLTTVCNPTETSFGLILAKTTNITGFNDIAATAIVSSGPITTSSGKVSEVTLVDTLTTYTGDTPQTGDCFIRIGSTGSGLTSLASASALSTLQTTTNTINSSVGAPFQAASAPTHFSSLAIDTSGRLILQPTGLDAIEQTAPVGPATTFPGRMAQLFLRFFPTGSGKIVKTTSGNTIKTYAADGTTVVTTQAFLDDGGGNETIGAAS